MEQCIHGKPAGASMNWNPNAQELIPVLVQSQVSNAASLQYIINSIMIL